MNTNEMTKEQLIEKIEELEQKVEELTGDKKELSEDNLILRTNADLDSDYKHDAEKKLEHAFFSGSKSGFKRETPFRAWLAYKIEARL